MNKIKIEKRTDKIDRIHREWYFVQSGIFRALTDTSQSGGPKREREGNPIIETGAPVP